MKWVLAIVGILIASNVVADEISSAYARASIKQQVNAVEALASYYNVGGSENRALFEACIFRTTAQGAVSENKFYTFGEAIRLIKEDGGINSQLCQENKHNMVAAWLDLKSTVKSLR